MSYRALPTVRVVNPAAPDSFMIINESDLHDAHELWSDEPVSSDLAVGKGPGGRWFVKRGRERVAGGFDSEDQANEEMAKLAAAS